MISIPAPTRVATSFPSRFLTPDRLKADYRHLARANLSVNEESQCSFQTLWQSSIQFYYCLNVLFTNFVIVIQQRSPPPRVTKSSSAISPSYLFFFSISFSCFISCSVVAASNMASLFIYPLHHQPYNSPKFLAHL